MLRQLCIFLKQTFLVLPDSYGYGKWNKYFANVLNNTELVQEFQNCSQVILFTDRSTHRQTDGHTDTQTWILIFLLNLEVNISETVADKHNHI